jgi:Uma2 family endonuclease
MSTERPTRAKEATEENWMFPPGDGWTCDQVKELDLPFDWELVDGVIAARGTAKLWHNCVRNRLVRYLDDACPSPYVALGGSCVFVDEHNPPKPDVAVFDKRGISWDAYWVPVDRVPLVVEVVSPGSRQDDRVRKPALFAQARVPFFWRVELEWNAQLAVHEFWLNHETQAYFPSPRHPVHRDKLIVEQPFAVEIDLRSLLEF